MLLINTYNYEEVHYTREGVRSLAEVIATFIEEAIPKERERFPYSPIDAGHQDGWNDEIRIIKTRLGISE